MIKTYTRLFGHALTIGFLAMGAASSFASDTARNSAEIDKAVRSHMRWIAQHSAYDGDSRLPSVFFIPKSELHQMYYGAQKSNYAGDGGILALYSEEKEAIFLEDDFDIRDVGTAYKLVHEVVHHLQKVSGVEYACIEQAEKEAYALQNRWVEETGFGEKIDAYTLLAFSTCRGEDPTS